MPLKERAPRQWPTLVRRFGQNYVYHRNNRFPFSFFTVRFKDEFFTMRVSLYFQSLYNNIITINIFYSFESNVLTHPTCYDLYKQACFSPNSCVAYDFIQSFRYDIIYEAFGTTPAPRLDWQM